MKTLVRTDQLSKELRQTFTNFSGLSPVYNFVLNGYTTGGQNVMQYVIEQSGFPDPQYFPNENAQALMRIIHKDDSFNRAIMWIDFDKPAVPRNIAVIGNYYRIINDVPEVICNAVEIFPITSTYQPVGFWYLENGNTNYGRPFLAYDSRFTLKNDTVTSTNWIGVTSAFRSPGAIGFRAINQGTGATTSTASIGYTANLVDMVGDTINDIKIGYRSIIGTIPPNNLATPSNFRGFMSNYIQSLTNANYIRQFVGYVNATIPTVNIQSYIGFQHLILVNLPAGGDNIGFAEQIQGDNVTMPSGCEYASFLSGRGPGTIMAGFDYGFQAQYYGVKQESTGLRSSFFDALRGGSVLNGVCRSFSTELNNATLNGTYQGIFQLINPSLGPTATVRTRVVWVNVATATHPNFIGDIFFILDGNVSPSDATVIAKQYSQLGIANSLNSYSSFTERYVTSNWNTGTLAAEFVSFDIKAVGQSGNPPNPTLSFFGNGIEKFNIQQSGDIEVTTANQGLILRSPNGSRWRVTVSDTGALITTQIS